jgi:hypothetical protein
MNTYEVKAALQAYFAKPAYALLFGVGTRNNVLDAFKTLWYNLVLEGAHNA